MGGITWRKAAERAAYVQSRKVLMAVEYNGYAFRGSQADAPLEKKEKHKIRTLSKPSVEAALKRAYEVKTAGSELQHVSFATRTESGVSATFNVAEATVARKLTELNVVQDFLRPMNIYCMANFPLRIAAVACVADEFSSGRFALSRTFRHTIRVVPSYNAYSLDHYKDCWYHASRKRLDVQKMDVVAKGVFLGRHSFSTFTTEDYIQSLAATVCTVTDVSIHEEDERAGAYTHYGECQLIHIDVTSDRFLPKQIEKMAAALVAVGRGDMTGDELLQHRNMVDPLIFNNYRFTAPRYGSRVTNIEFKEEDVTWIFPERGLSFEDVSRDSIPMPGSSGGDVADAEHHQSMEPDVSHWKAKSIHD